jgi:hypothetical protein
VVKQSHSRPTVTSQTTKRFRQLYSSLDPEIQAQARKAYALWRKSPIHPSLRFKRVNEDPPVYSVRITRAHRALGVKSDDCMIWYWIGSHDDYEEMITQLK